MYWIQIPFHGFRIPGTELQSLMVEVGFRTPIVGEIPDSKAHNSGFHRQNFPGFRIPGTELQSLIEELGYQTPIVSESPDFKAHDSGFHRQNFSSRIPDPTSKNSRIPESRLPYMGRAVHGVTLKDWGHRIQRNLPTPRNKVRAPPRK